MLVQDAVLAANSTRRGPGDERLVTLEFGPAELHEAEDAGNHEKRQEKAQEFIDWFGSAETQAAWSNEFFTAPTNEAALADADQEAVEQTASFEGQDIDWETVAANLPDWIEKIELQYL